MPRSPYVASRVFMRGVLLSVSLVLIVTLSTPITTARQDDHVASLDPVTGLVQVQTHAGDPHDEDAWLPVISPVLVTEGDRIRTDQFGLAFLTFFEGVEIEIRGDSFIVVSTLDMHDMVNDNFELTVDILIGTILTNVEVSLDANDRFEIHTPGATAVVRGTQWWTSVRGDGSTGFEGVNGTVTIVPTQPGASSYNLQAGETILFAASGTELPAPPSLNIPPPQTPALSLGGGDVCGDGQCGTFELAACPYDCRDSIDLSSCGNGMCEPDRNESYLICPVDCPIYPGAVCGNGSCDADESGITCPTDCGPDEYFDPADPALCGNGMCDTGESALNCAIDCVTIILDPDAPLPPGVVNEQLTLPDEITCTVTQTVTLIVQYAPPDDAILTNANAVSLGPDVEVTTIELLGPREFRADLYCGGRSGHVTRIIVSVTDTAGRTISSSVDVQIQ
ncbi:MAG: FecR family protein [Anaerolineae bacterium]|nr:FecR family protein [Anaerolineae bacterium]